MFQGHFVSDHASVQQKLHELTEAHRIGFCLGEGGVNLVESLFVVGLQNDCVMSRLSHIFKIYKAKLSFFNLIFELGIITRISFH